MPPQKSRALSRVWSIPRVTRRLKVLSASVSGFAGLQKSRADCRAQPVPQVTSARNCSEVGRECRSWAESGSGRTAGIGAAAAGQDRQEGARNQPGPDGTPTLTTIFISETKKCKRCKGWTGRRRRKRRLIGVRNRISYLGSKVCISRCCCVGTYCNDDIMGSYLSQTKQWGRSYAPRHTKQLPSWCYVPTGHDNELYLCGNYIRSVSSSCTLSYPLIFSRGRTAT